MFPPVTALPHSFQMTPHSTCIAACVRISWWRRSQSTTPVTSSPTAGTAPSSVCQTSSPSLRTSVTDRARQRAGVVRLPATRRIERGAVERDALAVDFGHGRRELAEVRVAEVQQFGHAATLRPRVYSVPSTHIVVDVPTLVTSGIVL